MATCFFVQGFGNTKTDFTDGTPSAIQSKR